MSRVEATIVLDLPNSVHVGDVFQVVGECRVVMIRDELLDVTKYGDRTPDYMAGDRSYELLIRNARAIYAHQWPSAGTQ